MQFGHRKTEKSRIKDSPSDAMQSMAILVLSNALLLSYREGKRLSNKNANAIQCGVQLLTQRTASFINHEVEVVFLLLFDLINSLPDFQGSFPKSGFQISTSFTPCIHQDHNSLAQC
jgi:hypothetical protein